MVRANIHYTQQVKTALLLDRMFLMLIPSFCLQRSEVSRGPESNLFEGANRQFNEMSQIISLFFNMHLLSSTWRVERQGFMHLYHHANSQDALTGSWMGNRLAWTRKGTLTWDLGLCMSLLNLMGHRIHPNVDCWHIGFQHHTILYNWVYLEPPKRRIDTFSF